MTKQRILVIAVTALALLTTGAPARAQSSRRVFVIVLENHGLQTVRNSTAMPFLNGLANSYALATSYFGAGHNSLPNYIAMTSGQEPNATTKTDCPSYNCLYDPGVQNIGDQFDAARVTWKAYMDNMLIDCQHPPILPLVTPPQGLIDPFQVGYATRHSPFVYYDDIVLNPNRCDAHVVPYREFLNDITTGTVPNFSFIVPDTCHDAHDPGCLDVQPNLEDPTQLPGLTIGPGDLANADAWLSTEVPKIISNPSVFRNNDVLFIVWDESETSDSSGCCDSYSLANGGGGKVMLVAVAPTKPVSGIVSSTSYNHYSLLRTIEDMFAITSHLGHASDPGVATITDMGFTP